MQTETQAVHVAKQIVSWAVIIPVVTVVSLLAIGLVAGAVASVGIFAVIAIIAFVITYDSGMKAKKTAPRPIAPIVAPREDKVQLCKQLIASAEAGLVIDPKNRTIQETLTNARAALAWHESHQ